MENGEILLSALVPARSDDLRNPRRSGGADDQKRRLALKVQAKIMLHHPCSDAIAFRAQAPAADHRVGRIMARAADKSAKADIAELIARPPGKWRHNCAAHRTFRLDAAYVRQRTKNDALLAGSEGTIRRRFS